MLQGKNSSEKVFGKLAADLGYSDKVQHLIWLWYHPNAECSADILDKKVDT
ncbi:MAG: hypothetical protein ACQCN3_03235 [Candidatus Bathyarchaeia archaeon]|jgi:hypothetical protein